MLETAEVSGTTLSLDYSEGLDGSSTPAADAYTVVRTDSSSATSTVGLASVDPVQVSGSVGDADPRHCCASWGHGDGGYTVPTGMDAMPVRDTAAVEPLRSGGGVPGAPASLMATAGDTQVTLVVDGAWFGRRLTR